MLVQTRISQFRRWMAFGLLIIVFISGCSADQPMTGVQQQPDRSQLAKLEMLNGHAEAMYRNAKQERYPEALAELEKLAEVMTKISYDGITTVDGLNAFVSLVTEARTVYHKVKANRKELLIAAVKVRLAADALSHKENPLWHEYRKLFKDSAEHVKSAIKAKNQVRSIQTLQTFHEYYLIVKPAVRISRDIALTEKLDSWFIYMNGLLTQANVDFDRASEGISHTNALIAELFRSGDAATAAMPLAQHPPFLWASMIAGAIVFVLLYVGYKKYRYMSGRI